jgi:hypothetical protein
MSRDALKIMDSHQLGKGAAYLGEIEEIKRMNLSRKMP